MQKEEQIHIYLKDKIVDLAKRCVKEDLSVRELEKLTQKPSKKNPGKTPSKSKDPFIEDVKNRMQKKLGTKVDITNKAISISYNNTKDLNRILEKLGMLDDQRNRYIKEYGIYKNRWF